MYYKYCFVNERKTEIARQHMTCFTIWGMGWFYRYMS